MSAQVLLEEDENWQGEEVEPTREKLMEVRMATIASRVTPRATSSGSAAVTSTTDASPQCWHEYRGGGGMEPNDEEQEWLDRMCDAADRRHVAGGLARVLRRHAGVRVCPST